MALINITPVMTSNNTPTPYVVSASNEVNPAWKAFDGTLTDSTDSWRSSVSTAWLKLDFGSVKKIDAISVTAINFTEASTAPKNFTVYGSNDNISFEQILVITDEVLWSGSEERLFLFPTSVSYRYFKTNFIGNNSTTHTNLQVGLLKFYQDDGTTPVVENRNNSLRYTLPYGSKLRLDNLTSDLSYMLATENDGDNFGTLRVVNEAGKFEIAKSGQKIRKLWGGVVTTVSTLTLEDNIENYSSIVLVANYATGSGVIEGKTAQSYPVVESSGSANEFLITLSLYSDSTAKAPYIYFKMEGNQLNITAIGTGGFSQLPRLVSIYGVY